MKMIVNFPHVELTSRELRAISADLYRRKHQRESMELGQPRLIPANRLAVRRWLRLVLTDALENAEELLTEKEERG